MDAHEQLLQDALKQAEAALREKATGENVKSVERARRALKDYRAELEAEANPDLRRFSNPTEVHAYLVGAGWKVSKSKVYEDRNKIDRQPDGKYTKKAVDEYARYSGLERIDGSGQESDEAKRKARADAEYREEQLKKIQRENETEAGLWVRKSEVEQKHTAKLALLLTAVGNFINSGKLEEACELVGGSKEKATEFKAFFGREFRAMLGEYAKRPEFTVPVAAMTEAEELIKEVEE